MKRITITWVNDCGEYEDVSLSHGSDYAIAYLAGLTAAGVYISRVNVVED